MRIGFAVSAGLESRWMTVAVPTYRRPQMLRDALASIRAQTRLEEVDVLVTDDGGLPETARVVAECGLPRIRHLINPRRLGAVGNWNRCLAEASGAWVTLLHEDDVLYPWFVETVREHVREGVVAVSVRCDRGDEPPARPRQRGRAGARSYPAGWFLKSSPTPFPGVVLQRRVAEAIGGFDARQGGLADYVFWYELSRRGPFRQVRETAAFYRHSAGQWTETEWPDMLRRAHLLRLRVVREELPSFRRVGRWLARFYTARMAGSYQRQFEATPAVLTRALAFRNQPGSGCPSGWAWRFLQMLVLMERVRRPAEPRVVLAEALSGYAEEPGVRQPAVR